jgi:hypothetical protein
MNAFNKQATAARIHQLQNQWGQDRAMRRRVPLWQTWRGCLGLAMLLDKPDDTQSHGDLALVRDNQLSWLAMRDITAVDYAGWSHCRHGATYATKAVAQLRYGMPVLDFSEQSRETVNFNKQPYSQRLSVAGPPWELRLNRPAGDTLDASDIRQFDVLNRLSAAMTTFAFFATDVLGKPWRPTWSKYRPLEGAYFQNPSPVKWMPRPYLGFNVADAERLVGEVADFDGLPPVTWFDPFCRSLAEGLVLRAIQPEVYCGRVQGRESNVHHLRSTVDHSSRYVRLGRGAKVLVPCGRTLEAAQPWARIFSQPLNERPLEKPSELPTRWARLRRAFDNADSLTELALLWFQHQLVRLPSRPDLVMVPANLVSHAVRRFEPRELWWDTAPALPHYDWEIQAAMLPPVPLHRWNRLHLVMPGDVAVDARLPNSQASEQAAGWHGCRRSGSATGAQPSQIGHRVEHAPAHCKAQVYNHRELTLAIAG